MGKDFRVTRYKLAPATSGATKKLKVVAMSTKIVMSSGKTRINVKAPIATPTRLNRSWCVRFDDPDPVRVAMDRASDLE